MRGGRAGLEEGARGARAGVRLPGLKGRGRPGLHGEGTGPGEQREDAAGRVSEEPSGWVPGASGRRGGGGARHSGGQRAGRRGTDGRTDGRSPLSSSPSLNCPLSPIRSCSCCCSRGAPGGLAPGGCTMAGSGVVSRGAAGGSIAGGAAGSGRRLWRGSEERAEHPARVRARGEEETPASEHQGDEDGRRTNSGCSAPGAARGRLIPARGGEGQGERGAASRRCPSPPRPAELRRRRERLCKREPPQPPLAMAGSASSSCSSRSLSGENCPGTVQSRSPPAAPQRCGCRPCAARPRPPRLPSHR